MIRHLLTEAGEKLTGMPWNTYPRPQMVRENWTCLNGPWRFGTDRAVEEEIRVPFCPESLLSGIRRDFDRQKEFFYLKKFSCPKPSKNERVLLHFGAVDQIAEVYINSFYVGHHEGGYLPFEFDVTEYLREGENELFVEVTDALDHRLPWGKQKKKRGGMWYTPVSGIWQTVWLETVPETYIRSLKISAGLNWVKIRAEGITDGYVTLEETDACYPLQDGQVRIEFEEPRNWTPETPNLYWFTVQSGEDTVRSYFALRELSVKEINGKKRLCLNGKPYFFHGLLDQGYFSDGIYTPAAPQCYEADILAMKSLGFNTLRKHIKVEPERFYYDCDRLGMVVFQDMVNNGSYRFLRDGALPTVSSVRVRDQGLNRDAETRQHFLEAMKETVLHLKNHPCICYWTIFNEGWGQFQADKAYEWMLKLDKSRFIDTTSGWFHQTESDVDSLHIYFKALHLGTQDLPQVLSEFGGYVWKDPEHSANAEKTYGYKIFDSREALAEALRKLYAEQVLPLVREGLCAAIYTQVSDVEDETNGMLTYDRKVLKIKPEELSDLSALLKEAVRE
ncbi:MAG: glycoside hydrolase family 2 [Lachnospiraceae bacterium]|nr:glycoside hydrolase family 2 [Lachnospiraceae bacterium]